MQDDFPVLVGKVRLLYMPLPEEYGFCDWLTIFPSELYQVRTSKSLYVRAYVITPFSLILVAAFVE